MNIANVSERFITLSGIDESQLPDWRFLIDDAAGYIESRSVVETPDLGQTQRLEALCAAYAYRLFCICNDNGSVSSFSAGDVKLTSSAGDRLKRANALWKELSSASEDILRIKPDLLRRVM